MKTILLSLILIAGTQAHAAVEMDFDSAKKYCASKGLRLPTPREMAVYAIHHGAKGILDTNYEGLPYNDENVMKEIMFMNSYDFNPISEYRGDSEMGAVTANTYVLFYYNRTGYIPKNEEFANHMYWTSLEDNVFTSVTTFDGKTGYMLQYPRTSKYAVVCVQ